MQSTTKRSILRRVLMLTGVLAVALSIAWFYFTTGRFIETDNAYIKAAKILVTPQITGPIVSVSVTDNQKVKAGDVLLQIDPEPYQIAVAQAKAEVTLSYTRIDQLKAQYRQKQQDLARKRIDAEFADKEYKRQIPLAAKGALSQSNLDETTRRRQAAHRDVAALQEEINELLAALTNNPDIDPEQHPLYLKAKAALQNAELNLARTTVKSPTDGIIGSAPHTGDYARAGVPLFNLVGTDDTWIEANYKETELTDVRAGQPVEITIDTYPGQVWHGKVVSISPATGAEFSILPAQNATGNWVKVVQRIGVRIAVDQGPDSLPFRVGMSTRVSIDTGRYPHASMAEFLTASN